MDLRRRNNLTNLEAVLFKMSYSDTVPQLRNQSGSNALTLVQKTDHSCLLGHFTLLIVLLTFTKQLSELTSQQGCSDLSDLSDELDQLLLCQHKLDHCFITIQDTGSKT